MTRHDDWLHRPQVRTALDVLDAHYADLGCVPGSERLEQFLSEVYRFQTRRAVVTLRAGFEARAANSADGDAIRDLAFGTWMTFLEPVQGLAELLDRYGPAEHGVGWPGAYGRQWAREASAAAWAIHMGARAIAPGTGIVR